MESTEHHGRSPWLLRQAQSWTNGQEAFTRPQGSHTPGEAGRPGPSPSSSSEPYCSCNPQPCLVTTRNGGAVYSRSPPQSHSPSARSSGPSHWAPQGAAAAGAAPHPTASGGTLKAGGGAISQARPPRPARAATARAPSQGVRWGPTLAVALSPLKERELAGVIHHQELAQQGLDDLAGRCA